MPSVTAATFPVRLGEREYTMTPLTDKDIEELDNYVKSEHINMVRASFTEKMTEAEKIRELNIAFQQAQSMSFMSDNGAKVMRSVKGVAQVLWQGMKKCHPDLKPSDISSHLISKETIEYCMKIWAELNVNERNRSAGKAGASRYRKSRSTRKLQGSLKSRRK